MNDAETTLFTKWGTCDYAVRTTLNTALGLLPEKTSKRSDCRVVKTVSRL